jgi:hypothetical protein
LVIEARVIDPVPIARLAVAPGVEAVVVGIQVRPVVLRIAPPIAYGALQGSGYAPGGAVPSTLGHDRPDFEPWDAADVLARKLAEGPGVGAASPIQAAWDPSKVVAPADAYASPGETMTAASSTSPMATVQASDPAATAPLQATVRVDHPMEAEYEMAAGMDPGRVFGPFVPSDRPFRDDATFAPTAPRPGPSPDLAPRPVATPPGLFAALATAVAPSAPAPGTAPGGARSGAATPATGPAEPGAPGLVPDRPSPGGDLGGGVRSAARATPVPPGRSTFAAPNAPRRGPEREPAGAEAPLPDRGAPAEGEAVEVQVPAAQAAQLLTHFLPFDQASLESAIDGLLEQLDDLGAGRVGWPTSMGLLPASLALAAAALAAETALRLRRRDDEAIAAAGDGEVALARFPGLPGAWGLDES